MYQVEFRPRAAEDFAKLDPTVADRVLKRLRWLAENFDSVKPESLTESFSGLLKLRVGDYRVIYQANREKKVLRVRLVAHRRDIYDQLA
jgi:mRNA interferase RelE/StbE